MTSVILGARTTRQLTANLGALDIALTAGEVSRLDEVSDPQPADYPYGELGIEQRSRPIG